MDPDDKDNLPAIGMANVLKKADKYDNSSAARDKRRKVCTTVGACVLGESSAHKQTVIRLQSSARIQSFDCSHLHTVT